MQQALRIYSDLHQEFKPDNFFEIAELGNEKEQILVLAGDYYHFKNILNGETDKQLDSWSQRFKYIFFVPGNHDYYRKYTLGYEKYIQDINAYFAKFKNIYFLNRFNPSIEIDGIVFIGATLFTNLNKDSYALINREGISDFKYIKYNYRGAFSKFKPIHWLTEFNQDFSHIKKEVEKNKDKKLVVITHHAVTSKSIDLAEDPHGKYTEYYRSDLDYFIKDNPNIAAWIHGHIHTPFDFKLFETRIKSNPIGYETLIDAHPENSIIYV